MRFGLQVPSFSWSDNAADIGPHLREVAQAAEEAGFDSLWVMDHFFQIPGVGRLDEPMLECYTTLGHLAAATQRVKVGALVTGVIYREPGPLVKEVTTLDVLSGGRAYFGIGAGWFEREARGLGVDFPPVSERFERLEEALKIAYQMWSSEDGPFQGKHFQLEETLNSPQPVQKPHPPIMIGGMGERKTLRLVAQYGDACNLFMRAGADTLRHKLEILRRHCRTVGREYEEIEKSVLGSLDLTGGPAQAGRALDVCREMEALGFDHIIFNMKDVGPDSIARFEEGVLAHYH